MMDARAYRKHLHDRLAACNVPEYLHEGLIEYLAVRRPVGHFLTAILSNDLTEACSRADSFCRGHIADVVMFLVNYAPANAWGSESHVAAWLESTESVTPLYE
jgi:hypothetical protein